MKTRYTITIATVISICFFTREGLAESLKTEQYKPCMEDPPKQRSRTAELQKLKEADQADRPDNTLKPGALFRDRQRRKRVGAIFGEGCFKSPEDYSVAALIYQHGDHSDHFFQAFLWSKRGVELGDPSQKRMTGLALDRYLINIGHKQLFASQALKFQDDLCWCLDPVEPTFPDELRVQYTWTLEQALAWIDSLNSGVACPPAKQCARVLKSTPQGTVPGFW